VHLSVTKKTSRAGKVDYFISIIKDIQSRKEAEHELDDLHSHLEELIEERTVQLFRTNELLKEAIAQQAESARQLRRRETELSSVLEYAQDAYIAIDDKGTITAWNQQASLTLGWTAAEAIGQSLSSMIIPRGQRSAHSAGMKKFISTGEGPVIGKRIELAALRKDGSEITMEVRIRAHQVDEQVFFSAFLHDISARKGKEAELDRETRLDALTGLPNRRAIGEILAQAQSRADQSRLSYAILFIDLDGFKSVNDSFGHDAGDQLLRTVADRLRKATRRSDCAARLAGDEFTVTLEGLNSGLADAHAAAEKILMAIAPPIELGQGEASVGASIGIAVYEPHSGTPPHELIKIADNAMYEAKRAGKGTIRPSL
jgi:diguanylate cyclase (GGDEF)-like protein/PAS domain S-box-containing protein